MNQQLKLISPIPPSVNHYLGYRGIIRGGKALAVSYCTNAAKVYKSNFARYVEEQCLAQGWQKSDNPFQHYYVDVEFYFNKIDMDCNNYWKTMLDAITDSGSVWLDDNSVCERVKRIRYDAKNPHLEITIEPVEYIGIFDNETAMNEFVSKCQSCRRYSNNCSLLNRAKEGRVQEEIVGDVCSKYTEKNARAPIRPRGKKGDKGNGEEHID